MTSAPRYARVRSIAGYLCRRDIARRLLAYWALVAPAVILAYIIDRAPL
jgi:hypothetical protein